MVDIIHSSTTYKYGEREEEEDIVTNSLIFFTRHTQGYSGLKLALDSVGSLCRCSRRSMLLVMCKYLNPKTLNPGENMTFLLPKSDPIPKYGS